jgi:hypothetical protein
VYTIHTEAGKQEYPGGVGDGSIIDAVSKFPYGSGGAKAEAGAGNGQP